MTAAIAPGWHVYSITQKAGGPIATQVKLTPSPQYRLLGKFEAVEKPESKKEPLFDNLEVETHQGRITWAAPIELAEGDPAKIEIRGAVYAQACDATNCRMPEDYKFAAHLCRTGVSLKGTNVPSEPIVPALPAIDVKVTGPDAPTVAVGSEAKFRIVVENRGRDVATGLTVKDRFPAALEQSDHPSPIEQPLPDLPPGQTKSMGLTFRVARAGQLCHNVEVLAAQRVVASAEGCVTAVEGPGGLPSDREPTLLGPSGPLTLKVDVSGPARGAVGEDVEFSIVVTNTTNQALTDVKVVYSADVGLLAKKALGGPKRQDGDLVWTLPSLGPGKIEVLAVGCRCEKALSRACIRATATSHEDAHGEGEACIEIREEKRPTPPASASGLSLTATSSHKLVAVGKEAAYEIRVHNGKTTAEKNLVLTAKLPAAMELVPLKTQGPATTEYDRKDQILVFTPLAELAPGETATYRITLLAKQRGVFHLSVDLSGGGLAQPIHGEAATEVFR